jgi:DNA-binding NarL/FixJ family response regulator
MPKFDRSENINKRNVDRLTPKEEQIWELHKAGKTRSEIAEVLNVKNTTVTSNLVVIRQKMAVMEGK